MSNENKKQAPKPANDKKNPKQQYSRPELSKHGNVEKVTQFTQTGPSGPVQIDRS